MLDDNMLITINLLLALIFIVVAVIAFFTAACARDGLAAVQYVSQALDELSAQASTGESAYIARLGSAYHRMCARCRHCSGTEHHQPHQADPTDGGGVRQRVCAPIAVSVLPLTEPAGTRIVSTALCMGTQCRY